MASRTREATLGALRVRFRLQLAHLLRSVVGEREAACQTSGFDSVAAWFLVGELRRHFAPLLSGGDKEMRFKHLY